MLVPSSPKPLPPLPPPYHRHLRLSHATMRIHFSLIAWISGNKGNERAASYGLIHQELIEASLVSSADRAGVVVCAVLYVCVEVFTFFFLLLFCIQVPLTLPSVCESDWVLRNNISVCVDSLVCMHACMQECQFLTSVSGFRRKKACVVVSLFG